mmetsp:Transcript_16259/g.28935  ORF Transcript_16259/g.28935 Transcript_16259/m.28935 type:complete len:263 (+) Transcript_16259:183-971(+)
MQRVVLHRLPNPKVGHDFLRPSQNGAKLCPPHVSLHNLSHARPRDGSPTKHLASLVQHILRHPGGEQLEQSDGARQVLLLLREGHVIHLIRHALQPVLHRLNLRHHVRQLVPDDRLLHQSLVEGLPLLGPLDALLNHQTAPSVDATHNEPALVVEVVHDALETVVLLAQQVPHRNLDILIQDVGRPGGGRVASLDCCCAQIIIALDQQQAEALLSSARGDKVVTEGAVSDPFLGSVHDVKLPAWALNSSGLDPGDIASRMRL